MAPEATLIAVFGPTGVGKTGVAIMLSERLRALGEDPIAISCDSIAVYRGLETISGAPGAEQRRRLEHRLVGIVEPAEEFSAGRFAALAEEEIAGALASGRRPILVGGTGLYMRAALTELELRPPVAEEVRAAVEAELAEHGPEALHAQLAVDVRSRVHPSDRKRIARALELLRSGIDPPERSRELWTAGLRRPTLLVGVVCDREVLARRIDRRVEAMAAAGAGEEARAARAAGASRTACAAIGFEEFISEDLEAVKTSHRRYARRQMSWLRKTQGIEVIDRTGLSDAEVARRIEGLLGNTAAR
jgi:tRNA dimethylallyltransferase